MARKRQVHEATESEWQQALHAIRTYAYLDDQDFRVEVEELARELEREGFKVHRSADHVEGLSRARYKAKDVRVSEHSLGAIRAKLRVEKYGDRHLHVVQPMLERLVDTGLSHPKVLRRQAAALLDAADEIDEALRAHAAHVARLRKERKTNPKRPGRPPSVALDTILDMMDYWGVKPETAFERLAAIGIDAWDAETLKVELWRRHQRAQAKR